MTFLDRIIATIDPVRGLKRQQARTAAGILAHYAAAVPGRRANSWVASGSDADTAAMRRQRLAWITRDMIRNTPYAARAKDVIANNTVGDGIIPKIVTTAPALQTAALEMIERHLDTTTIDASGVNNLYGIQRLVIGAVVESGEVFIRRRRRFPQDGIPYNFQLQVLESDYLDEARRGRAENGNEIREGIEYDVVGKRVAYYFFDAHPGSQVSFRSRVGSRRVPAEDVAHVFRQDRPGQQRGVSWFSSVALQLQDAADHQDAQLMRQKIAACFSVFITSPDEQGITDATKEDMVSKLSPGAIMQISGGQEVKFATPPGPEGYEEFTRSVHRSVAAGLGITYEALTGDLSNVNFSSARMGRMEMDRNVSSWQWTMMIPQFMDKLAQWMLDAWFAQSGDRRVLRSRIQWVPPHRILVDPTREIPALANKVRAGFASRSGVVRELGFDPERLIKEIKADAVEADELELIFSSDARRTSATGVRQSADTNEEGME